MAYDTQNSLFPFPSLKKKKKKNSSKVRIPPLHGLKDPNAKFEKKSSQLTHTSKQNSR